MHSIVVYSIAVAAALFVGTLQAQTPASGTLLVSTALTDRNFAESVVLMVHHDDDGSLGILVNRPTNLRPVAVFPEEPTLQKYDGELFLGGPVGPSQPLVLLRAPARGLIEGPPVVGDIYISADLGLLGSFPTASVDSTQVRFYAGHAAWGAGQLAAEIAAGSWHVVSGRADLVFSDEPLELWRRVSRNDAELVVAGDGRRSLPSSAGGNRR
jgi:putative transcriptional regulator